MPPLPSSEQDAEPNGRIKCDEKPSTKWWHVADDAIERLVRDMAGSRRDIGKNGECHRPRPASAGSISNCSIGSGRSLQGTIDIKIMVKNNVNYKAGCDIFTLRISPDAAIASGPGATAEGKGREAAAFTVALSLQERIERATHIPPSRQRLFYREKELRDGETLRSAGICHGQVLQLVCCPELPRVVGAKSMQSPAPEAAGSRDGSKESDARPKWVCQEKPRFFVAVGAGMDNHGGMVKDAAKFQNEPIYVSDVGNSALDRIRALPCYVRSSRGGA